MEILNPNNPNEPEIDFDNTKCAGCHIPITDGNWDASIKVGPLCRKCLNQVRHEDLKLQVDIVPNQRSEYDKKWIRDIHIKDFRLYGAGSEILMVIGYLLESFLEAEKSHGNTNIDYLPPSNRNVSTWTDREHFEHWLMLWHQWKNNGRFNDATEDEMYDRLPDILKRAWD